MLAARAGRHRWHTKARRSQSRGAPIWANSIINDPAYGLGASLPDYSADRNRAGTQPLWNDPTRQSFDPRLATPLDPNYTPTPYSQTPQRWRLGI